MKDASKLLLSANIDNTLDFLLLVRKLEKVMIIDQVFVKLLILQLLVFDRL